MKPSKLAALIYRGGELTLAKQFDEAAAVYLQAVQLAPDAPEVWSHMGVLYALMKNDALAESCYRRAIFLDPGYAKARFNLGYVLLRQGRYEEGWLCMESRDWYAQLATKLACPRWQGEPLAGRSLLIGFEAGHGDMIQMVRYAALAKRRGAKHITLLCHPALKRLFASLADVDRVVGFDEPLPTAHWDYWTPPFSLPFHCQTRVETIPSALPYLQADPDDMATWASQLPGKGLRVGLAWRGSAGFENDADRSTRLPVLVALSKVEGVRWVSLQKGVGEDEVAGAPPGWSLLPLGAQVRDFADTAALITHLDLVISVDTAVAHLAGALGKPVWVLLPHHMTDWRWLEGRSDSPWYPGVMRLFRQTHAGDWTPTVTEVRQALAELAGQSRSPC